MDIHYGQIVEKIVRRNGYSITELARLTKVNRRSVYNWFNQKHLKPGIIFRIGNALNYDFSKDLPQLFSPTDFQDKAAPDISRFLKTPSPQFPPDGVAWKNKYIQLLEDFNLLLIKQPKNRAENQL